METVRALIETPVNAKVICPSCDWKGVGAELELIGDCGLTPGDEVPAGRCPECDCLAYVVPA